MILWKNCSLSFKEQSLTDRNIYCQYEKPDKKNVISNIEIKFIHIATCKNMCMQYL